MYVSQNPEEHVSQPVWNKCIMVARYAPGGLVACKSQGRPHNRIHRCRVLSEGSWALCLSHSQYQFGLAYSLPAPVVPCQYAVPALEPLNDVSFPIETGYFSRAPPGLLRLSV